MSIPARADRRPNGLQSGAKVGEMSGRAESAHPALKPNSGMQFPQEPSVKEKDPFAEVLVNSRWRGRESRPRSARADRCGASAACELRWQTLTRLLSSAPSRGSIPRGGHIKEKDPFAEVLVNSRWRGRESRPRSARADRCGASAACELRWQTLTRLLSSAPRRVRTRAPATKKATNRSRSLSILWWAVRGSNPGPWD